jgi:ABC-type multidrug transport system permease subunit
MMQLTHSIQLKKKLDSAKSLTDNSRNKIATLRTSLAAISAEVDVIQESLETTVQNINNIEITSSDQIVNPINTNIETVSSDSNQLIILFPYVLLLVIMFVGLMLASTLVMVEKKSKSSFRIFTTPTKDQFFIFTTFTTAFIIVAVQIALILVATNYFLVDIISANLGLNIVLLILSMAIFIMLGMALGYALGSQQGTNMASISVGAIFLFFSNIMLPLETLPQSLQNIAYYNPYVLASETLRKSILFHVTLEQILYELAILLGYTVVVILLILLFQRIAKIKFFSRNPHVISKAQEQKHAILWIGNKKIEKEKELIKLIQEQSEDEYREMVTKHTRGIKRFLKKKLGKQEWMKNIKTYSKEQFIIEFAKANKKLINELQVRRNATINEAITSKTADSKKTKKK